jgi:glyoxylase-like metal-dependent hydrolase (beta-lactamase superfamily II)
MIHRRDLLAAAAGALAAGALPRLGRADEARPDLEVADLGGGLFQVEGAGANVVVALGGTDGLLLVDGGSAERSADLAALLAERWPGERVGVLFNTNWRPEHTGANEMFGAAGAKIMAHENTKLWLGGDFRVEWEDRRYRPRPSAALPTATFYTSGKVEHGGREVEYLHLARAHTDGDVCVLFRDANVLAASDLLSIGRYPIVDYATGGWIGGLEEATRSLLTVVDADTRIVPAVGPAGRRADLEAQLELCAAVRQRVAEAFRQGMSFADFVAARPTREFDAQWGDPSQFLPLVYKGGWAHIRELGGVI